MRVFIGMETSGALRRRFIAQGHEVISCDTLPAEDGPTPNHMIGDVFVTLERLRVDYDWVPDLGIFHPTCTFHTLAAAWAFNDPDYARYPGVGYHQKVQAGTLTGAARRQARKEAEADCERIKALKIKRKVVENPKGTLPTRTSYGKPHQIVQPYQFGDDASKGTCLWFFDQDGNPLPGMVLPIDPAKYVPPTLRANGKSYWGNQTDTGQNNATPGELRWKERSRTFDGIADAGAEHWGRDVTNHGCKSHPHPEYVTPLELTRSYI